MRCWEAQVALDRPNCKAISDLIQIRLRPKLFSGLWDVRIKQADYDYFLPSSAAHFVAMTVLPRHWAGTLHPNTALCFLLAVVFYCISDRVRVRC